MDFVLFPSHRRQSPSVGDAVVATDLSVFEVRTRVLSFKITIHLSMYEQWGQRRLYRLIGSSVYRDVLVNSQAARRSDSTAVYVPDSIAERNTTQFHGTQNFKNTTSPLQRQSGAPAFGDDGIGGEKVVVVLTVVAAVQRASPRGEGEATRESECDGVTRRPRCSSAAAVLSPVP
ncbi:hypothetical protein HPB47_016117 [Ixodes persulcatus]|uniref:Uncharacterized protein n=1 Tax=Ixodes persulcatus TaxID=34615 RepID=A0AC60QRL8_IXOPE|nr:hypothetical protein HPB47_016117 [Ixodes persulcatus]